eukprot:4226275-Amphidinium_carterae.1
MESILRADLLDGMSKFLQTTCTSYGLLTSGQILTRLLRKITADHSRMALTKGDPRREPNVAGYIVCGRSLAR